MKNFSLFILAVALFGVMVAVSFLKAERSQSRSPRQVEESLRGSTQGVPNSNAESAIPDELHPNAAGGLNRTAKPANQPGAPVVKAESVTDNDELRRDQSEATPSLENIPVSVNSGLRGQSFTALDTLSGKPVASIAPIALALRKSDTSLSDLRGAVTALPKAAEESLSIPKTAPRSKEDEIIGYLTERLEQLPDDLTSYEKKVAIKEVRDEVCEVFRITPGRLKKLTKKHKVEFP
ncbi:MAG: hypothetical protein ACE5GA_04185 [Candidatus Zixiibacteriota bacterium]